MTDAELAESCRMDDMDVWARAAYDIAEWLDSQPGCETATLRLREIVGLPLPKKEDS